MSFSGFPFPWKQFEQIFGIRAPENPAELAYDAGKLEAYVRNELARSLQTFGSSFSGVHIVETDRDAVVNIKLPKRTKFNHIRIRANRRSVKLEGDPEFRSRVISLPAMVDPKTSRTVWKNDVLQIRLRKVADDPFQDVPIRFM